MEKERAKELFIDEKGSCEILCMVMGEEEDTRVRATSGSLILLSDILLRRNGARAQLFTTSCFSMQDVLIPTVQSAGF